MKMDIQKMSHAKRSNDTNDARSEELKKIETSISSTFPSLRVWARVCLKFNQFEISNPDILNVVDHESNCQLRKTIQI